MKVKDLIMKYPRATDNELIILYYENLGFSFNSDVKDIMCSKRFGITSIERKFRDYNHLRSKLARQQKLI